MPLSERKISFKKFVMRCAEAFIFTDGNPIPAKFKVTTYHKERIEEAKKELARIKKMSEEELNRAAEDCYREEKRRDKDRVEAWSKENERYNYMIRLVKDWTPPTSIHKNLKRFMLQQLRISLNPRSFLIPEKIGLETGEEYKKRMLQKLKSEIQHHTEEHEKEEKRTRLKNDYVKTLRDSL